MWGAWIETMFKLGINTSGVSQSFTNIFGDYSSVEPLGVFDFTFVKRMPSYFDPVTNFLHEMKKREVNRFYVQRTYALGDMLEGVPVIRYLRQLGWDAVLRVPGYYSALLAMLDVPHITSNERLENMPGLIVDWILERDMTSADLGRLHRVHIYFKALGINDLPSKVDWSADLSKFPEPPIHSSKKYVVMAGQGANYRKQLDVPTIELIIDRLNKAGIEVFYNGDPDEMNVNHELTHLIGRRLNVPELFGLIARAACLVTVDTGTLWIGHFTNTPTVAILGPSHPDQRLSLHPLYPEGARAIMTNDWINCPSCTENGKKCNRTMRCLHSNSERLAETVVAEVAKFYQEQV